VSIALRIASLSSVSAAIVVFPPVLQGNCS
jgi:hypothetical protein